MDKEKRTKEDGSRKMDKERRTGTMRKRIALLAAVSMLAVTMPTGACLADTTDAAQSEESAVSEAADLIDETLKEEAPDPDSPAQEEDGGEQENGAQDGKISGADAQDRNAQVSDAQDESSGADHIVTTKHTAVIQGREIAYTAEAGTMFLTTGGEDCEIFFTAYTLDGVEDPADRPITFAYNGGPGTCSMYIHIGCLGPRRVDVDQNGYASSLPVKIKDNENSLLDLTDIVIIDAVGTGYSRPAGDSGMDAFSGYDNDNRTMGDFIRQYINRHHRWGSKKYLAGESYGTTRSVGICQYLHDTYSVNLNGLILISTINDFATAGFEEGNDLPYALYTPTYAADAWYNGMASPEYLDMELEDFLDEVRSFVENEYYPALFKGNRLTEDEKDALAEKYAGYTGLTKEYVLDANFRVPMDIFLKDLLKKDKLMVGRCDGRITGPVTSGKIEDGASDPSMAALELSYGTAMNNYITDELGFRTDRPYIPTNLGVNEAWTYPIGPEGGYLSQENTIFECMSKNSFLNIWVLCGYYDAATPFYAAEYTYSHVFLNDDFKDNLSFTYYPCGHMIYMEQQSFDKFRKDAEAWYGKQ